MHIKLMEPVELDGIEYPAGKVLKVSRAAGVELLKDQVAVPAPPEHARSVLEPEEQRRAKKRNRIDKTA